jgi:hypothetical protein
MSRIARLAVFAVALALPASAFADPRKEGEYTGAKPGVRPGAESGKPQKPPKAGTLSWIGFEAKDGGSAVVWLQAAGSFNISQRVQNGVLVVTVTGLKRLGRNTWRPVDTRFFDNPLSRIVAKKKKRAIEIRISFKNPKDAKEAASRTATEADGLFYTYLDFPPGTGGTASSTDDKVDRTGGDVEIDDER